VARERLQKILAQAGVASRRAAEGLIEAGRVRVNGRIVSELGASADARKDAIELDGKRVTLERPVYFVFHKPRGMVTTIRDPEGRPHLGEVIAAMGARVYPIGRLDFHTSGVLLVTNDGELTDALLHPRKDVPKTYVAKVRGQVAIAELDALRHGVVLDDGTKTKAAEVFVLREEERNTWLQITLFEGKNRQIHRMGDAIGHPVLRLARTEFAGISAEGLRPGQWRPLEPRELEKLKKTYLTPARRSKDRSGPPTREHDPRASPPAARGRGSGGGTGAHRGGKRDRRR
jgi:23S rRNA pseudouridine2605 synthase